MMGEEARMVNLKERDWYRVLEAIKRGHCILLTGSDIVVDDDGPDAMSVPRRLARKLADALPPEAPAVKDDLAHVAQLRYNEDRDRSDLEFEVKEFFAPLTSQTSAFHRDLAALPFTLCLTTTPDNFMAQAFQEAGKAPIQEFYHFRQHRQPALSETSPSQPIVYGLYGHLRELDSLVLTETDLLEFLVNVVRDAPSLPPYIAGQLADPQTSFLFLGFGFQRWYTRVLLHVLKTFGHRNRSLAVEASSFFAHPDSQRTALFYEQEHKIEFRQHSWGQFAAELRRQYEAQRAAPMPPALPADAPKVFLCHDSRDRDQVVALEQQLQALGVSSWRDQQDLRGGEDWDRQISRVIGKQVDYVLVLQTPQMLQRPESYLHKEIKEALERQDHFDQGERFLIPVILQPCEGLERLSHLHRSDLTAGEGIRGLAGDIHQDWKRRLSRKRGSTHEK
ncbi:MAG: toll/interleukin-1 receptor domain-containing protein [Nitrospira sp.]|nr:toll/interleukin-1 receptor domain-containing protein [Nitrospira sp.]